MTKRLRTVLVAAAFSGVIALAGCSSDAQPESSQSQSAAPSQATEQTEASATPSTEGHGDHGSGHEHMDHPADGGPVPAGMVDAASPEYPVGSEVVLTTNHMHGMEGATATIVGAYDTFTYAVTYTPTDGGPQVTDHKWVVQEEIENAGSERLADGTEVTLTADHMAGMKGAKATIASSTDETVYVVDYEADGMKMTNHKWVVASEIKPVS
ncbi:MAG: YdhK family protein [Ancrocorticia sp.]